MTPTGRDSRLMSTMTTTRSTTRHDGQTRGLPTRSAAPAPAGAPAGGQSTTPRTTRSTISMDWRDRAACLDEDPELFFPIGNTGPAILQIEEAKAVCRRCDVMDTCLKWALESGQDAGVWGGLSEDERRALKRRNARARRAG
ncbi:transcription factor WhiB [Lapillicoccus jejuensis]|uniref:Transcriptional regulator WhiB n=2 Tax=Lapillicoccus jejuensis TaxID=402171 RepID=A0A542E2M7_9MICO|nr:transcription factor WhiB [Lapillicoccus jejuensis]